MFLEKSIQILYQVQKISFDIIWSVSFNKKTPKTDFLIHYN